ncbi:MAG: PQQ-dependent sugar dehydrogenase [Patescibacteria group bacterium]
MKRIFLLLILVIFVGGLLIWQSERRTKPSQPVPPAGYTLEVYAQSLDDPRVIAFDPQGRMLVSETSAGRVTLVTPDRKVLLEELDNPHGLAFYEDRSDRSYTTYLYVATTLEVARYAYDVATATVDIASKKNIVDLPKGGKHFIRTIGFGKDFRDAPIIEGLSRESFLSPIKLYVSVGSSCDACLENSWKYASILESDSKGTYTAEVAGGLRNSEFFTFHPTTGELWASEQSRSRFPDEINIIKPPLKYGWPYCYGNQMWDTTFTETTDRTDLPMDCTRTEPPVIELPENANPRGIVFLSPTELLVAYQDKIVLFDEQHQPSDFMNGSFADLKIDSHGDLFISDDSAGIIYRVSRP